MTSAIDHLSPDEKRARLAALLRAGDDAGNDHPVSYGQAAMMHLHELAPESVAYNTMWSADVRGPIDPAHLRRAFAAVVERHGVLRSTFHWRDGEPRQAVHASDDVDFTVVDSGGWTAAALDQALVADAERPFDLGRGPVVRLSLYSSSARDHVVLCSAHHVAVDYWSLVLLMDELQAHYADRLAGRPMSLPAVGRQYVDHARWQREYLSGAAGERLWQQWRRLLEGPRPRLSLPLDQARPAERTFRGVSHRFTVDAAVAERLRALAGARGTTLYAVCLAAFKVLLHRYTGETDLLVGSPMAGRTSAGSEAVIGYFANTIVLRTRCDDNPSFTDYLARVSETVLDALDGQDFPFPLLVEKLKVVPDPARAPICDVLFSWDKPHYRQSPSATTPRFETREVRQLGSIADLTMVVFERAGALDGAIQYCTDLFEAATIARMAGHYANLLRAIGEGADRRLDVLPLLGDDERRTILVEWNATRTDFPRDRCVHQLFEDVVARVPEAIAVIGGGGTLTYRALDQRANAIAAALQDRGVGRGTMVGIALSRTPDTVATLLGILKAGGVYVALDPAYPAARLAAAIREVRAPLLVVDGQKAVQLSALGTTVFVPDELPSDLPGAARPIEGRSDAGDLAYVVFTSGSTGTPKGVGVPHRAIVRLVRNTNYLTFGPDDVFLHAAPLSFDASTLEIWAPLLNGGRVALLESETPSLEAIGSAVRDHGVTVLWLTAGLFHLMVDERLDDLRGLRALMSGGDVLSPAHVARVRVELPDVALVNGYGPTENTTFTTCHRVTAAPSPGTSVPIGRPIANTTVYVLDDLMQPVPVGIPGELWTGGDGLAVGYVNDSEMTAERFVPDPFSGGAGVRLYRTGDLVRYRANGDLEFIGRRDQQVKVRGFRIELGEVEQALRRHPGVRDCVVAVLGGRADDKRLVAYVVPSVEPAPEVGSLRATLAETLPEHAIPSQFVVLDALPLSANGKVDRRALLDAAVTNVGLDDDFVPAGTETEQRLARLWAAALGTDDVGIHNDFFALGGHSLLAQRLVSTIRLEFDVTLPLTALFDAPTVAAMAATVDRLRGERQERLRAEILASLDGMSDDQVEAALARLNGQSSTE